MLHIVKRIQCEPDTPHTKKKERKKQDIELFYLGGVGMDRKV
jgi:hypothetical protein